MREDASLVQFLRVKERNNSTLKLAIGQRDSSFYLAGSSSDFSEGNSSNDDLSE